MDKETNMLQKRLRFALFGNEFQSEKSLAIQRVLNFLKAHGAEVYIDRPYYDFLTKSLQLDVWCSGVFDNDYFEADFVISLGGDGTILKAANRVGAKETPIVGINMGRLGFLADVLPDEIDTALQEIYTGQYKIEEHSVIMVETDGESLAGNPYALNDIALLKRDHAAMISVRCCVDGDYLVTYQADGLIVSTPTGSTAYSLSNGGPIIVPSANNLCITPVAPHSLNMRPVVVNDNVVIELEVESRNHNYLVAVDGRSERMQEGTKIIVRKAPHKVKIVKQRATRYFTTLRDKLMWGVDQR